MTTYIAFILTMFLLSLVITYLWWTRFRVWALKQDIFAIRDRLWLEAAQEGFLDDPSYIKTRNSLNAVIRLSPRLCLPLWLYILRQSKDSQKHEISLDSQIPQVRQAVAESSEMVRRYVFNRTLSGLIYRWLLSGMADSKRDQEEAKRAVMSPELIDAEHACFQWGRTVAPA